MAAPFSTPFDVWSAPGSYIMTIKEYVEYLSEKNVKYCTPLYFNLKQAAQWYTYMCFEPNRQSRVKVVQVSGRIELFYAWIIWYLQINSWLSYKCHSINLKSVLGAP